MTRRPVAGRRHGGGDVRGGILHTLPFLLPQVSAALYVAFAVVGVELLAISFVRYRYFGMGFLVSAMQVVPGGALVFAYGVLTGSAQKRTGAARPRFVRARGSIPPPRQRCCAYY